MNLIHKLLDSQHGIFCFKSEKLVKKTTSKLVHLKFLWEKKNDLKNSFSFFFGLLAGFSNNDQKSETNLRKLAKKIKSADRSSWSNQISILLGVKILKNEQKRIYNFYYLIWADINGLWVGVIGCLFWFPFNDEFKLIAKVDDVSTLCLKIAQ